MRYNKLFESQSNQLTRKIKNDSGIYWDEFISFLDNNNNEIEKWIISEHKLENFHKEWLNTGMTAYLNHDTNEFDPFACVAGEVFAPIFVYFDYCYNTDIEPSIRDFKTWKKSPEFMYYFEEAILPFFDLFTDLCEKACNDVDDDNAISLEYFGMAQNVFEGRWDWEIGYIDN